VKLPVAVRVGLFVGAYFTAMGVTGFMPLWYADRGLSPPEIGQILGAASLLRVLAGPQWGGVADRLGRRRPVLTAATLVATAMALIFPLTGGFWPVLLVAAGQGVAASAINPLADSLALSLARQGLMEYGPVRAVGSATFMLATAAAGSLLTAVGSWLVPFLLAIGYGTSALLSPLLPEADVGASRARGFGGWELFKLPAFRLAVACTALIQGAHAAYYGFAALLWRSQGLSDRTIGLLIAEGIVVEILLFWRGRRMIERLGPAGLTACAATASIVRWSAIAFSPGLTVLVVVQLLHAATFAMQHLSSMLILGRAVPPERAATAQALHAALGYGIPAGAAMFVSGLLYARFGGLAFLAMALLGGSALLLVRPLRRVMA
jgi:PPP family 3-phenylpropionic acid transporter